ncbi:hypothetical protein H0E84_12535 [Luteimonas sp. SJ-92]|uniref:Uncharacterized protein n=1 Tax=Luteimonas salinisoli TaxID=2752307 RepID=A0A853JF26_9GAMM|nr:hypothetical protein [Luteimonas salinisoli]NZA27209.1 hypothetical protein [Luteimonas salinisoli]
MRQDAVGNDFEWSSWGIEHWNERLLEHFFSNRCDEPPVAVLLVTSDELARATGDPLATADAARTSFVEAVNRAIGSKGLLEDASNYRGFPMHPPLTRPRFIAHLILTCLAASESSEELADESSFIARLRKLAELHANSLSMLPILWTHLQTWLSNHDVSYRRLVLPDPGGLTRIGYTVRLTFPDRRDQQRLSRLLDDAGFSGAVPPIARTLSLVASQRSQFSVTFQRAFDDFRRKLESTSEAESKKLSTHRLWAAVVDAALRGRGHQHSESLTHYSVLAEDAEDILSLFVTSDRDEPLPRTQPVELFTAYGPWKFGLVPEDGALDTGGLHAIAGAVLSGALRLPRVSALVDQGVLPFALRSHGLLELVGRSELDAATYALVRQDKLADTRRIYSDGTDIPSAYPGWAQIRAPGLKAAPASTFHGTTLAETWILHESLSLPAIGIRGGVRTEEGWLGLAEVLPKVVADDANRVWMEAEDRVVELARDENGLWLLPPDDWSGLVVLKATWSEYERQRDVRFNSTVVTENFKAPNDPDAWLIEGMSNGSNLGSADSEETSLIGDRDGVELVNPILLGAGVGEFVSEPVKSAWAVTPLGRKFIGRCGSLRGDDAIPTFRVDSANARRRWRKLLLKSDPADSEFAANRDRVKGKVASDALPSQAVSQMIPDLTPRKFQAVKPTVDRLVRVISGRAATRAGIPWREWKELTLGTLDIDARNLAHVTRAWMEAGFIDVASFARWRRRCVFARAPKLLAYRAGGVVNAIVSGLSLPATQAAILDASARLEMLVLTRRSISALVPPVLRIVGNDEESISLVARQVSMPITWLRADMLGRMFGTLPSGAAAPTQYDSAGEWHRWSLKEGPVPGIRVEHFVRADRPDYWLATHESGSSWAFELNPLRQWAAAVLGEPLVVTDGPHDLVAHHGYLPLSVARLAGVLGQGLAGPSGSGEYRYPVGAVVRANILAMLR